MNTMMDPFRYEDFEYLALGLPESTRALRDRGDFVGELADIRRLLDGPLPDCLRKRLAFEEMIAQGMMNDYHGTPETILSRIREKYPSCDEELLATLFQSGYADYIFVNGERRYQDDCAANLLKCCQKQLEEREHPETTFVYPPDTLLRENARLMRERGSRAFRYRVRFSLTVDSGAQRPGEKIRVWLPAPAECAGQSEIRLLAASGEVTMAGGPQPTVYFEKKYEPGEAFFAEFSYVRRAEWHTLSSGDVESEQPRFYLDEVLPHICFTPTLRALAREIRGRETNPLLIARRVYDYITTNIKYSYMRSYRLIDNIPEFCALSGRGDCGVQALLFITLCRILGIPARWESGNAVEPGKGVGSHDWAMFYIAPYGWLYADPSYGGGAARRGDAELCAHYFGHLDPFRMVCATAFQQPFYPEMRFLRHDPYDNQSGEAEYESAPIPGGLLTRRKTLLSAEEV